MFIFVCVGTIKWKIQELSAQGSGEQVQGEEIAGLLSVPQRGQGSEAPTRPCVGQRNKIVPGLHMVRFASFH